MTIATTETTERCNTQAVDVGSIFSRHSFGKVTAIEGDTFHLCNSDGFKWQVGRNIIAQEFSFAEQHDSEEKLSRTDLISLLTRKVQTAMTVCFRKKVDAELVARELADGQQDMADAAWKKHVNAILRGEERTMIGHHYGTLTEHGRLNFHEASKGYRQIDPRTIEWVIVERVKYLVRK